MPRPFKEKKIQSEIIATNFAPSFIEAEFLSEVVISKEEIEAIRLGDVEKMRQRAAATAMGISQPTFYRLLSQARGKMADALVNGKLIRVK
ncbi:MAG: DUF134 domain-containing protein [Candidatus Diapherotrites archaeon]